MDRGGRYRADIDGLRAIAVVAVVLFHAFPGLLPGGFVGVDVFFVISGFLISGLIRAELQAGTFSIARFYARRGRRLFPALAAMLAAVWMLGYATMEPTEFASLGRHMLAGAAFAANILTFSEVGYFDVPATTKPLLHLWSLGVEEQFYMIYPALLVLLWRSRCTMAVVAALAAATFIVNLATVGAHPSFAFYLPFTRFWEFAAGAWLAYRNETSRRTTGGNALLGIALLALGSALTRGDGFPGAWALLPVVGTALIIGAGPNDWFNRNVLASRGLVSIGLISYPLYLWHWPLLVIGHTFMVERATDNQHYRATSIAAVALSFLLAWLTYQYIERPVRAPGSPLRKPAAISAGALAAVAVLGFATMWREGLPSRYPAEVRAFLTPVVYRSDFPDVDPARNMAGPMVVTYGDSHAAHLDAGLRTLQQERAFRVASILWGDCAPIEGPKRVDQEACGQVIAEQRERLLALKPDIVLLAAFWRQYKHVERLEDTIRSLQAAGVGRVVIIGSVPFWPQPPRKLIYQHFLHDGWHAAPTRLPNADPASVEADARLREIAARTGAVFLPPYAVLCGDGTCLVRLGNGTLDIVQIDNTHFSAKGSSYLIQRIADGIFG